MVNLRFNRFRFGVGASQRIRSNQFLDDEVVEVFQLVDELGLLARSFVRRARRISFGHVEGFGWKRFLESDSRWRWCLQQSQLTKFSDDLVVEDLQLLESGVRLLRRVGSTHWEEFSSVGVEI